MFASVIIVSFIMKHPVLSYLGVAQPDVIESLSIPAQQIARATVEHNDFTDAQREMLNNVVEIDKIVEEYNPYLSDPIKELVREKDNLEYISDNKLEFAKLYIDTGLKHPTSYIKAWIDQTKGYWNGGYNYWRWGYIVSDNDIGLHEVRTEKSKLLISGYSWIFQHNEIFSLFLSIGFHVWILLFLCFMSIVRKDRLGFFITIPILAIIISLLISTPVYSEFRYMYSLFCSIPFIIISVFYKKPE